MNEEQRAKEISAADFGLPVARARGPGAEKARRHEGATRTGGSFVAFYASQSDEISLELAVPRGAPPERQSWVSAFTDAMVGALQRGRVATYRDLLDETARSMRAQIPPRTRQTPATTATRSTGRCSAARSPRGRPALPSRATASPAA